MRSVWHTLIVVIIIAFSTSANAQSTDKKVVVVDDPTFIVTNTGEQDTSFGRMSSRVGLLFHADLPLTADLTLAATFIPSPNMLLGFSPSSYLEVIYKVHDLLQPSLGLGWSFREDAIIISPRVGGDHPLFTYWILFDLQPQNKSAYLFAQVEWKTPISCLQVGLEEESWGDITAFGNGSFGGGPNIILPIGERFQADLALHIRTLGEAGGDKKGWEFLARFHVQLHSK